VDPADLDVAERLRRGNVAYEERFGHVFLINATGRSAEEMLEALRERLRGDPETELAETAEQQRQITRVRLEKLVRPVGLPLRDGA
jgi:OHCU decarboxylase